VLKKQLRNQVTIKANKLQNQKTKFLLVQDICYHANSTILPMHLITVTFSSTGQLME